MLLLLCICIIVPVSCSKNQETSESGKGAFDIKAASNVVEAYMKAVEEGNMEGVKKFYSKNLLKNFVDKENPEFKIMGYNILETSKVGDTGLFKIRVSRSSTATSRAALDEYVVKVIKEGFEYKVDDTKSNPIKEAFPINSQIRLKSKNNVNTSLVFDVNSIPSYTFAKEDKAHMDKLPVPKYNFGSMTFSYDGNKLAISTIAADTGFFAGFVKIDESIEVQGSDDTSEKKGGNGNGGMGGQNGNVKEKPVGKELIVLDVIKEGKPEMMIFSQDEKYIALQYGKTAADKLLRVYKVNNGDLLDYNFEKNFPVDKVNISYSFFDKDNLYFIVAPKNSSGQDLKDYIGKWQLDLKELKAKKV